MSTLVNANHDSECTFIAKDIPYILVITPRLKLQLEMFILFPFPPHWSDASRYSSGFGLSNALPATKIQTL